MNNRQHVIAGLFAGVGGLERGLARAGHETALLCENDPGAVAVLESRFEETDFHMDVRTLRRLPRGTTLLAAGFPCQDLSQAGRDRWHCRRTFWSGRGGFPAD